MEVLINNGNKISGITNWSKLDPVWCFLENTVTVTVTVKNLTRKSRKILEADGTKNKKNRNRNTEEIETQKNINLMMKYLFCKASCASSYERKEK